MSASHGLQQRRNGEQVSLTGGRRGNDALVQRAATLRAGALPTRSGNEQDEVGLGDATRHAPDRQPAWEPCLVQTAPPPLPSRSQRPLLPFRSSEPGTNDLRQVGPTTESLNCRHCHEQSSQAVQIAPERVLDLEKSISPSPCTCAVVCTITGSHYAFGAHSLHKLSGHLRIHLFLCFGPMPRRGGRGRTASGTSAKPKKKPSAHSPFRATPSGAISDALLRSIFSFLPHADATRAASVSCAMRDAVRDYYTKLQRMELLPPRHPSMTGALWGRLLLFDVARRAFAGRALWLSATGVFRCVRASPHCAKRSFGAKRSFCVVNTDVAADILQALSQLKHCSHLREFVRFCANTRVSFFFRCVRSLRCDCRPAGTEGALRDRLPRRRVSLRCCSLCVA